MERLEVWKFGGASVADAAAIRHAAELISRHRGPLVIVVSALQGITDLLLDGAKRAASGDARAPAAAAAAFLKRHKEAIAGLLPAGRSRSRLLLSATTAAREYEEVARALVSLRVLPARVSDLLISRGERMAALLLAAALRARRRKTLHLDATLIVATDDAHGNAAPDLDLTRRRARALLRLPIRQGLAIVLPGFIGRAPDSSITTIGRGGTDLSATLMARVLGARRVVLWKDVPGILTANPRLVPDARLIPQLHHREAAEAAYYGAKVLQPRALIPLDGSRIQMQVRSFLEPDRPGTEISSRQTLSGYPVKAIATIAAQALVTVAGKGLLGVPGVAARTFGAAQEAGLSVSTIFQASSESSIGFTIPEKDMESAVRALRRAFREELLHGLVDSIDAQPNMAVVAVVGNGMAGTPGIAARVFGALADAQINVIAIAQGSSERNISFVVRGPQAVDATRRVHAAFQLSKIGGGAVEPPHTDVVLLGFGRVGRSLTDKIAANSSDVRIVGLIDRSGYVFDPDGLKRARLLRLARTKDDGRPLSELGGRSATSEAALAFIAGHAVSRPILVDVTAADTGDLLHAALEQGFDLVLANKKPLAGSAHSYDRLLQAASEAGRRLRFEATVGAGLPIIDTYRKLADSGDKVLRIEGCVSGTLGYVLSAVSAGRRFSDAVREAVEKGYAEPDPREDLSGMDAARKGLILARLLGYRGAGPAAENLVPAPLRGLPLQPFLARLPSLDDAWARRVDRARLRSRVLRYVVAATRGSVRADLVEVKESSPIGSLQGTRNLISFTTRRYRNEPLIVTGPGAGADVTAAGILNDIQHLAATRG